MATSFVPVTITARLRRRDGRELRITAGDIPSKARRQFLEFVAPEERRRFRITWSAGSFERATDVDSAITAVVHIDDHDPLPVLAHSGRLFVYDESKSASQLFAPDELRWLGEYLLDLKFNPAGMFAGPGINPRTITAYDVEAPAAVGCIGAFAGAGAGVGASAGAVAGGVAGSAAGGVGALPGAGAGAGVGAALGGAVGGLVGVGYCVVGPAWDWLFGGGDDDDDGDGGDDDDGGWYWVFGGSDGGGDGGGGGNGGGGNGGGGNGDDGDGHGHEED